MRLTNYDVAKVVRDLMTIAKVAMPKHLLAEDRRLQAAQDLLALLNASQHRPPVELRELLEDVPHLGSVDPEDPDAERIHDALNAFPKPDLEVAAGIDAFLAGPDAPATRPAAIEFILRDWLIGHGYIQHRSSADPYH